MGLLDRYRRLPYLEPEKQRFVILELASVVIISAGCIVLLITLLFETAVKGLEQEDALRTLRILIGFFVVIVGLVLLLLFMYRHVSALEKKMHDLEVPKEPESYKDAIDAEEYVERSQREREERKVPLTPEEEREMKMKEARRLAERINALEEAFDELEGEATFSKCPICGELFTENWDTCPKCGAKIGKG